MSAKFYLKFLNSTQNSEQKLSLLEIDWTSSCHSKRHVMPETCKEIIEMKPFIIRSPLLFDSEDASSFMDYEFKA